MTDERVRPVFYGPLEGQRPAPVRSFGGDVWLLLAVFALLAVGLVMVFNVGYFHAQETFGDPYHFFAKHLTGIVIGLAACFFSSRVSPPRWRQATYVLLLAAFLALVVVLIPGIGVVHGGARRWLRLGPLAFQPTEIAKFAVVLFLAHSLAKKGGKVEEFAIGVVPHCLVVGVIALLCLLEPDFGTVVLLVGVLASMLFVAGVRPRHLLALAGAGVPVLGMAFALEPYRMRRILAFLHPDADPQGIGYQLLQSFTAFGSGQLWGIGLGNSRQKMFYLPAAHTDFIYSVIGEELGLLGALVVLGLFVVVAARGFRIALRHPDSFASLLAFGTTLLLVLEALVNVAVVLGRMPTKGLALPFVSYGGSAVMLALAEVGVLLALAREVE